MLQELDIRCNLFLQSDPFDLATLAFLPHLRRLDLQKSLAGVPLEVGYSAASVIVLDALIKGRIRRHIGAIAAVWYCRSQILP